MQKSCVYGCQNRYGERPGLRVFNKNSKRRGGWYRLWEGRTGNRQLNTPRISSCEVRKSRDNVGIRLLFRETNWQNWVLKGYYQHQHKSKERSREPRRKGLIDRHRYFWAEKENERQAEEWEKDSQKAGVEDLVFQQSCNTNLFSSRRCLITRVSNNTTLLYVSVDSGVTRPGGKQ